MKTTLEEMKAMAKAKATIGRITVEDAEHTVVDYKMPPEPPIGTVIVDGSGTVRQLAEMVRWSYGFVSHHLAWCSIGESKYPVRPAWPEILAKGPVTVLWQPPSQVKEDEPSEEGPEQGHTFEVSFRSRGSYAVTGDPRPTDAPGFDGESLAVQVRAWNLRDALEKAAMLPLGAWFRGEEG